MDRVGRLGWTTGQLRDRRIFIHQINPPWGLGIPRAATDELTDGDAKTRRTRTHSPGALSVALFVQFRRDTGTRKRNQTAVWWIPRWHRAQREAARMHIQCMYVHTYTYITSYVWYMMYTAQVGAYQGTCCIACTYSNAIDYYYCQST